MKTLITLIPGLGSENVDATNSDTWPSWIATLRNRLLYENPANVVVVGNYTDARLPEKIISVRNATSCSNVVIIGHSDGAACADWIQSHVSRRKEDLLISILILLDDVNDIVRHGFLSKIDPNVVDRCIRIFQTADPNIKSNPVYFYGTVKLIENMWIGDPPFSAPSAIHVDIPENQSVQNFISDQIENLGA